MTILMVVLSVGMLSGCIKDRSDVFVEEVELRAAAQMSIVNALGSVTVNGADLNNQDGVVFVKTEKYVDTYSLFGLASPNEYVDVILAAPTMQDGTIKMAVQLRRRSLFDRLLVRIVPHVNRVVEAPTLIATDVEVQFGDLELRNLPGGVKATVNVGKITVDSPLGVLGEQHYAVNVGELAMRMPEDAGFRYDIAVDIGSAELQNFDVSPQRRLLGVRAVGLAGLMETPGFINAQVNIGTVTITSE